jgi:hypothetical protein
MRATEGNFKRGGYLPMAPHLIVDRRMDSLIVSNQRSTPTPEACGLFPKFGFEQAVMRPQRLSSNVRVAVLVGCAIDVRARWKTPLFWVIADPRVISTVQMEAICVDALSGRICVQPKCVAHFCVADPARLVGTAMRIETTVDMVEKAAQ